MEPQIFSSIPLSLKVPDVYRALGYSQDKTVLKEALKKEVDACIEDAKGCIQLKGAALRVSVKTIEKHTVILEKDIIFKSRDLANFLKGSSEILLMGATAGKFVMEKMAEKFNQNNFTCAVVYNATAGEMADEALTWITDYFRPQMTRERLAIGSRRFSVGYGDLAIEYQEIIWHLLRLENIGITITPECFLIPEKSVTAICGVRPLG